VTTPVGAGEQAFQAALKYFDGVPAAECQRSNPQQKRCLMFSSQPQSPERGIALIGVSDPGGGGGAMAVFARDSAGAWVYWFATQNVTYRLLELPGDMIVCADGTGVRLRAGPSTTDAVVGSLTDGTKTHAEQFVLTEPAPATSDRPGYGWYQLADAGNRKAWVYSKYLSDARLGNCDLRNLAEAS
jgi:hypothetical protein